MANEIELKFCLTSEGIKILRQSWLPRQQTEQAETQHLANTYFDTPELALNKRRVALRLREKNGQYIQTLKTKGESVGGLHQRGEWEWEVEEPRLYPELLIETAFPAEVAVDALRPLFRTDFERTAVLIRRGSTLIELAFDEGSVIAGDRQAPILEVELELKEGALSGLFDLAQELAEEVPVWLSDVSKAERGYWLAVPQSNDIGQTQAPISPEPVDRWFVRQYRDWLRLMEWVRVAPSFASFFHLSCCVSSLLAAVSGLAQCLPGGASREDLAQQLVQELQWLQEVLAGCGELGAEKALTVFEASHRAGLLSLQFSKYFAGTS